MEAREIVSPLAQLLEGIHSNRREQADEAFNQIRTLLEPSATPLPVLDGSPRGLYEVVRVALAIRPELACAVNPDDGSLPLHHAAGLGDMPITELLLTTFPKAASFPNKKGKIPLHFAAREGRTDLVRFLLFSDPVTATIPSKKNKLALHFAAGEGHLEIVRQLLELYPEGALTRSAKGKLPLHFAARWGHLDVAEDLIRVYPNGIRDVDVEGSLPLHDACREGQVAMAEFLFRQYPRGLMTANIRQEIPLFPAVRTGNLELVIALIQAWPAGGRFVLQHACQDDNVQFWRPDILELILRGAVCNFTNCALLDGKEVAPLCSCDSAIFSGGDETDSECSTVSLTSEEEANESKPNSKVAPCSSKKKSSKKRRVATYSSCRHAKRMRLRSCSEFHPLHWAMEGGANVHVLGHVLELFPDQVRKLDCRGRLPLHVALEYACQDTKSATLVLEKVLKPYPEAAAVKTRDGRLALHLGLSKRVDYSLISGLLEANPASGLTPCEQSEKLPAQIALENNCDLSTLYALLRRDPCSVLNVFMSS